MHVRIDWAEIKTDCEYNLEKTHDVRLLAPYDLSSAMHYSFKVSIWLKCFWVCPRLKRYMRLNLAEIKTDYEYDFEKAHDARMLAPYDLSSAMHYSLKVRRWDFKLFWEGLDAKSKACVH